MAEKVVIYEYDFAKDKDVATGSIVRDGKKMTAVGGVAKKILDELTESGIRDPLSKDKKRYYPKDGSKFLRLLKFRYDNPYLRASDVMTA
jgi:hypothetical protein